MIRTRLINWLSLRSYGLSTITQPITSILFRPFNSEPVPFYKCDHLQSYFLVENTWGRFISVKYILSKYIFANLHPSTGLTFIYRSYKLISSHSSCAKLLWQKCVLKMYNIQKHKSRHLILGLLNYAFPNAQVMLHQMIE